MARGGEGNGGGGLSWKAEVRLQLDNKTLYGKARNFYLDERQDREGEKERGERRRGERRGSERGRERQEEKKEELARLDSFVEYSYFSRAPLAFEIHFQGSVYAADG